MIALTLELVSWPDTLRVGEVGTREARILDPQGRQVSGAHVTWSTSGSEILSVEPIGSGLQARLTARGPGTASVTVRASGERFQCVAASHGLARSGDTAWWWQELRDHPRFRELVARH